MLQDRISCAASRRRGSARAGAQGLADGRPRATLRLEAEKNALAIRTTPCSSTALSL
jgi:hypothetical protein